MRTIPPDQVVENRFELAEPVDGVGRGTCWKARDRRYRLHNKLVRLLRPLPPGTAGMPDTLARTFRSLQSVRHAAVLPVIHHGLWQGRPFVVHEWFDGVSFDSLFAMDPTLRGDVPIEAARAIIEQVCSALDAALQTDPCLVHGSLEPRDVLVKDIHGRQPEVRVVDFGVGAWEAGAIADATPLDDVRAVGRLLRVMLASPSGRWRPGTPSGVVDWIERCASPDVAVQAPTMKALRDGLRGAWSSEPVRDEKPASATPSAQTPVAQTPVTQVSAAPVSTPPAAPPTEREPTEEECGAAMTTTLVDPHDEALLDTNSRAPKPSLGRAPVKRPAPEAEAVTHEEGTLLQTAIGFEPSEEETTDVTHRLPDASRAAGPEAPVTQAPSDDATTRRSSLLNLGPPRAATPSVGLTDTVQVVNFPPDASPWQYADAGMVAPMPAHPVWVPTVIEAPRLPAQAPRPASSMRPWILAGGVFAAVLLVLLALIAWSLLR